MTMTMEKTGNYLRKASPEEMNTPLHNFVERKQNTIPFNACRALALLQPKKYQSSGKYLLKTLGLQNGNCNENLMNLLNHFGKENSHNMCDGINIKYFIYTPFDSTVPGEHSVIFQRFKKIQELLPRKHHIYNSGNMQHELNLDQKEFDKVKMHLNQPYFKFIKKSERMYKPPKFNRRTDTVTKIIGHHYRVAKNGNPKLTVFSFQWNNQYFTKEEKDFETFKSIISFKNGKKLLETYIYENDLHNNKDFRLCLKGNTISDCDTRRARKNDLRKHKTQKAVTMVKARTSDSEKGDFSNPSVNNENIFFSPTMQTNNNKNISSKSSVDVQSDLFFSPQKSDPDIQPKPQEEIVYPPSSNKSPPSPGKKKQTTTRKKIPKIRKQPTRKNKEPKRGIRKSTRLAKVKHRPN